jgi:hypothetical protein
VTWSVEVEGWALAEIAAKTARPATTKTSRNGDIRLREDMSRTSKIEFLIASGVYAVFRAMG